jgi:SAM-dependent methyltransferase
MERIISRLPEWAKKPVRSIQYYGKGRFCPVCGKSSSRFCEYGVEKRQDARCIHCGALERHRLLWLYLQKRTDLFNGKSKKMLHVAPEACFVSKLRQCLGSNYLTADLNNPQAMVKMDITNIEYSNQSFDVIFCCHVLQHCRDDRKAMSEFYRILRAQGWLLLQEPVTTQQTIEDPTIVAPEDRLRVFGQHDRVRRYGPDYLERLRETGFIVEITKVNHLVTNDEAVRMGLTVASGDICYCTK